MRASVRRAGPVLLMLLSAAPLSAQSGWSVALQLGADRFWGGSIDDTPEHRSFRPHRPTTFAAVLQRQGPRMGLNLRLGYAEASMALEGEDAVVAVKDVFSVVSLAPAINYRIATLGAGNSLFFAAGPLLELWDIADLESRTRLGAQTSAGLVFPLGGKFAANISGALAIISSPFREDELPPEYRLRALWRRSLSGGLEYRF